MVLGYQRIRPILSHILFSVFGYVSECKHSPTCSEYTIAQIRSHGTIAGILRGGKRILTCW